MKYIKAPSLSTSFSNDKISMKNRIANILDTSFKKKAVLPVCALSVIVMFGGVLVGCKPQETNNQIEGNILVANNEEKISVNIEEAIKHAILDMNKGTYLDRECEVEGHILLDTSDVTSKYNAKEGTTFMEAYVLAMYGEYGFQNGIFTKVSGSGIIPTTITFSINEEGEYSPVNYKPAEDGSMYIKSIKDMFPEKLWNRALSTTDKDRDECTKQEEAYAKAYLTSINREAKIGKVERVLANMNVECANTLLDYFYEYPYWIGTEERVESGVRYVYEKAWVDKGNGEGTVTFKKYQYDNNTIIDETIIEIKGEDMTYLKGEERMSRGGDKE